VRLEHGGLTLGALPLQQKRDSLVTAGFAPGLVEETDGYFVTKLDDPDGNLVGMASTNRR